MHNLNLKVAVACFIVSFFAGAELYAQIEHEPYPVHDTKPVIVHSPYLLEPSEKAMTVVWMTDTPSHARVVYGKEGEDMNQVAEDQKDGMLPVGTLHSVRLRDLEPG